MLVQSDSVPVGAGECKTPDNNYLISYDIIKILLFK